MKKKTYLFIALSIVSMGMPKTQKRVLLETMCLNSSRQ